MDRPTTDRYRQLMAPGGAANRFYGAGVFRRRVLLANEAGKVHGELEDCSHGFRVELKHDGVLVTAASMQALRFPLSTCAEAERPLAAIVGCRLDVSWRDYSARLPAAANCTHIHDMAWWALGHAARQDAMRQYDVAVTDETDHPSECTVRRNGELVHRWFATQGRIVAPAEISDRPLFRGFSLWAATMYQGEIHEAAVVLQRGYLVAQARRHFGTQGANYAALDSKAMHGVCYSYSPGAVERAVAMTGSDRDFTDAPELLLKFSS